MTSQQSLARRSRTMNAATAVFTLVGFLLLGFRDQILTLLFGANRFVINEEQYDWVGMQIFAMGLLFAAMGFFLVLLRYLRGELSLNLGPIKAEMRSVPEDSSLETSRIAALEDQVSRIEIAIGAQGISTPVAAIANIEAVLLDRVAKELPTKLMEQLNTNTIQQRANAQIRDGLHTGRKRLERELASIERRGTVNLAIGSVTTAVAVVLLYQAATTPPQNTDLMALVTFYVPRVTLAIFVEVFSFFFLRLYRTGLVDLKYFHGELLTLDLRIAALETAISNNDQESLRHVVSSLVDTDRTKQLGTGSAPQSQSSIDEKLVLNVVEAALKLAKPDKAAK
jgi:hypothetical protein